MPHQVARKVFSFYFSMLCFLMNKIIDLHLQLRVLFALFDLNILCSPDKRLYFIAGKICLFSFFPVNKSIKLRISFHPTEQQQRVIRLKYLPILLENCVKSNKRKSSGKLLNINKKKRQGIINIIKR